MDLPNVKTFKEQIQAFTQFLAQATPDEKQSKDIDYLLALGDCFCLVAYGQLILENKPIFEVSDALMDEIFDFMVRDFSKYALTIYSKPSNSDLQRELSLKVIKAPLANTERFDSVWQEHVYALKGQYKMWDE